MHELSIALSLVELADEAAQAHGAERVSEVHLRLGEMAGVVRDALEFSFPLAAAGTRLEGAHLAIEMVPLLIACVPCGQHVAPAQPGSFRCPRCGTPSAIIVQGRELELARLELIDSQPA